jgi:hypothetical protein
MAKQAIELAEQCERDAKVAHDSGEFRIAALLYKRALMLLSMSTQPLEAGNDTLNAASVATSDTRR